MSPERAARLRRWHDDVSAELHALGAHDVEYLGLRLHVPAGVFPPAPMSRLLGRAVSTEAAPEDRVLDMGTGCGVNAILAARAGARVVAVDVNPSAVSAAEANALACGVAERVECRLGDLFGGLDGTFDLVVFDPPFRWFAPGDLLDRAFTDDGYRTLTAFFDQVPARLGPGGRVLMFFGSTGDADYFHELVERSGLSAEVVGSETMEKDGSTETYWAFRLVRR